MLLVEGRESFSHPWRTAAPKWEPHSDSGYGTGYVGVSQYEKESAMSKAHSFVELLQREITSCRLLRPEMYATFDFTLGNERVSHARMIGLLVKTGWEFPGVAAVDVENDFKLTPKWSWKPDVVLRDDDGQPMLAIDFESPNSSDARIESKDVKPFLKWCESTGTIAEYLILTSLPKQPTAGWPLLYTSPGCYNESHKGQRERIRMNPFDYWYCVYRSQWQPTWENVTFANLNGLQVGVENVSSGA